MEIDDREFSKFWGEFREFRGEVRTDMKNMNEHISAVSKKADRIEAKADTHIVNTTDAHGKGAEERASKHNLAIWGLCLTVIGLLVTLIKTLAAAAK